MGNFRPGGKKSGGNYKRKSGGGGSFGDRKPMFNATCNDCGARCELPFKPSGGRPVFCRDCFKKQDDGDQRRTPQRFEPKGRDSSRELKEIIEQLKMIGSKIDSLAKAMSENSKPKAEPKPKAASKEKKTKKEAKEAIKKSNAAKKKTAAKKPAAKKKAPAPSATRLELADKSSSGPKGKKKK